MVELSNDIIVQAANGDTNAFEKIYRTFSGFTYRVAIRMVNNPQDAEEIVQDVFMRVFGHLKKFRFESSIKTWIYRITVNTTLNFRKKRSRRQAHNREYHENIQPESEAVKPQFAQHADHQYMIDRLLHALNPDQRACIVLRSIEGLSYEEIAQTLNTNINTVRTRLKRAREKLISLKQEVVIDEI